jgi:benzodiazapine receptor
MAILVGLLGFLLITAFVATIVRTVMVPAIGTWYRRLTKPSWTPPAWVFGPVWTVLYALMAMAAWLVWRHGGWAAQSRPVTLYLIQLALNAAWSVIFFGIRKLFFAFVAILALWVSILATLITFLAVDPRAGWLLIPYLVWVTYATALNYVIWRLNS